MKSFMYMEHRARTSSTLTLPVTIRLLTRRRNDSSSSTSRHLQPTVPHSLWRYHWQALSLWSSRCVKRWHGYKQVTSLRIIWPRQFYAKVPPKAGKEATTTTMSKHDLHRFPSARVSEVEPTTSSWLYTATAS
jgi:hypothetical protein